MKQIKKEERVLIALGFFVIAGIFLYFAFATPEGSPLDLTSQAGVTYYAASASDNAAAPSDAPNSTAKTAQRADASAPKGRVNLNTASFEELLQVPGIGEVKAASILAYREQVAPFQTVDDLKNIQGFGEKTVEKLRDYVTV